ncbi:hypothetical protein JOC34_003288 [Virgibacillus halotolerans]|uniref:hypothetical protein n=1 Tax=Virgibacillus halotolerans TaxID=1071053 RepID=UPI0019604606|nr:hypothetical protein [Virgibacillus halotolerans]MBM7600874.1 hypothetical protein [Virgibacillus halotolerans]
MKEEFSKPKGFGEILDHTFRLCKNRFPDFFMIVLIVMGPIYLLQAIILLLSGTSFVREVGSGEMWFEQIVSTFDETRGTINNFGAEIGNSISMLLLLVFYPIAAAAVLFAIQRLRNGEDFTAGIVIKKAFSKFWGIFGSSLLVGIIAFGMIFVSILAVIFIGVFGAFIEPVTAIILSIILFLGAWLVIGLLFSRWGFYLGPVIFEGEIPGMGKSWRLTKKRTWKVLGLFLMLLLITGIIGYVVNIIFGLFLGNSVLFTVIAGVVSLFTAMIFMVGYAVIYFDLVTRHDGSDLKEMIADYHNPDHVE